MHSIFFASLPLQQRTWHDNTSTGQKWVAMGQGWGYLHPRHLFSAGDGAGPIPVQFTGRQHGIGMGLVPSRRGRWDDVLTLGACLGWG
jgi:hypothetical protein